MPWRVLSPRSVAKAGPVSTNVTVRDLDTAQGNSDSRRLEVIAEGLSLFGGVKLALDATLVSAHHGDGTPVRKTDTTNGVAPRHARKRKADRYPELCDGRKSQDGGYCR